MNLSYWEQQTWFKNIDFAIIGSGLVGLNCALHLRKIHPNAKITVFEKGVLPSGASTKNAGFACFGSISEILEDLTTHTEDEVITLVKERVNGLGLLRETIGDTSLQYKNYGGYEVFLHNDNDLYDNCIKNLPYVNSLLKEVFTSNKEIFSAVNDTFHFQKSKPKLIVNSFEGQINTGEMMRALLKKVNAKNISVLNGTEITNIESIGTKVRLQLNNSIEIIVHKVCIATNGFANKLLDETVIPARAQVLITKPIKNLHIKGTFHLDRGYYYFRNIDNRILLGGGRHLDYKTEETSSLGLTQVIQNKLESLLEETILPDTPFEIDHRWSGIMGVGPSKRPILKEVQPNIFCAVRLGGMGVAIGSTIGKNLANLAE